MSRVHAQQSMTDGATTTQHPTIRGLPSRTQLRDDDVRALNEARHRDPFAVLGPHRTSDGVVVRAFLPGAAGVTVNLEPHGSARMQETAPGLFETTLATAERYTLEIDWRYSFTTQSRDPYAFGPLLSDYELFLINQGRYADLPRKLGANPVSIDGVDGVLFSVWAPNASYVAVVGNFNSWDWRRHPMRFRTTAGIWEIFIPGIGAGEIYKYALRAGDGSALPLKADPMARQTELPPRTGSVVAATPDFIWSDQVWMNDRASRQSPDAPISIYEVHVQSWLTLPEGGQIDWDTAAVRLVSYAKHMGFTHLEIMPITEYPFGGSWGYQPLSMFAPTARLGDPASFARFVDRCHAEGLAVILDWVPGHFPSDEHGLGQFDGTALYEHSDPREGFHLDWNTLIYNYGRSEVRGFLIASALWWLETFHIDGLRVDAVASMLYRDYSRPAGQWIPNKYGGRENLEAVDFIKELNATIRDRCPGAIVIAEESTAWPGVTAPVADNGLGFHFKWNMGWMHDTLHFFGHDSLYRRYHLSEVTFGLHYGFSEAFILPLSHDEVVHGKGSLLSRMPGDDWQRFANLRLLLSLMWTHPGKKLLFMGGEFGAEKQWNADSVFPWPDTHDAPRHGLSKMVADLNRLYLAHPQLHALDTRAEGFEWVIADDTSSSVFAFRRASDRGETDILVVANTTPVPRHDYRIGVPAAGFWSEIFNSDSQYYAGSGVGNSGGCHSQTFGSHGMNNSVSLTLPPLGVIVLELRTGALDVR